eukprot:TRINITY_DN9999_c0_g1_i1.p1 TRINITY_DN9999_c0_g1~~TRINITY_DN9999_c0_g1_i1.p1  ORF type:complete len:496 (-),score=129.09 TRINITY_DN9999_c0_g1_i1:79-1530(-)
MVVEARHSTMMSGEVQGRSCRTGMLAAASAAAAVAACHHVDRLFVGLQADKTLSRSPRSSAVPARGLRGGNSSAAGNPTISVVAAAASALGALALRGRQMAPALGSQKARTALRADGLADCPYALYGQKDVNIAKERKELEEQVCPLEVSMPEELRGDIEGQRRYFADNLPGIYKDLKTHGAIVFRGFEISKESETFGQVGQALQLEPCEDPLHSVAARDAVDKKAGVYEAVNKPSRSKFYIGMHNEMVGDRAPGAALFVCFKAADEGGEFLVADGRKMFRALDEEWLDKIYKSDVVYSTAEFPMGFIESLPEFLQGAVEPVAHGALTQALKMKVDFKTELRWEKSDYDGSKILQVRAMPQAPIVRHPATGEPCWWGSMHSHAEFLRTQREKVFGEAQETTGSSRINKTDVYYGDTGEKVEVDRLKHLDQVTLDTAVKVKMQPGDMVLLDNYLVMHGRCPFEGTRLHAVSWFKSPDYSKAAPS